MQIMTKEDIRSFRESKGWTTTELAFHVGVTNDAVRKWSAVTASRAGLQ